MFPKTGHTLGMVDVPEEVFFTTAPACNFTSWHV